MKTINFTITGILAAALVTSWWSGLSAFGQDAEQPGGSSTSSSSGTTGASGGRRVGGGGRGGQSVSGPSLTRFDLSFPGGQPRDLVKAIEKALGRQLNVIIRDEDATVKLPALNLKNVTVVDLFSALQNTGEFTGRGGRGGGGGGFGGGSNSRTPRELFAFQTRPGEASDDSIWTFSHQELTAYSEPKDIRYYNLAPYLETFKIDDITTAVRTGWEMLGDPTGAKFSFHKDTKLLIAVGRADQLALIDSVLKELEKTTTKQAAANSVLQKIYIAGEVRTPGPIEIPTGEKFTVGKAILRAGGFAESANKKKVRLIRTLPDGTKKEEVLNMEEILERGQTEKDSVLKGDDFIIVTGRLTNF